LPARIIYSGSRRGLVSGKWSALVIALCFLLTAILLPVAAHLPRWVEVELVIGGWWVVWCVAITWMLHRGCEIKDDVATPDLPAGNMRNMSIFQGGNSSGDGRWYFPDSLEDLQIVVWIVVALALGLGALWLAVELVIPGLAFLMYALIRSMLTRVVNDRHDCSGSLVRSVSWGTLWATLYTLPIGLAVWAVHAAWMHLHH
jgi:hypothetical protein